jgi:phosphoserine phosphatase
MNSTEISRGLATQDYTPPLQLANFKLIAFDMDSTLINTEFRRGLAAPVCK